MSSCRDEMGVTWRRLIAGLMAGLMIGLSGTTTSGAGIPVSESQLKAAWLLNFAKLTEWPQSAFSSTNQPIVIGVMEDESFEEQLERSLGGKAVHGRRLVVRNVERVGNQSECHILVLGAVDQTRREGILRMLKDAPVLTIDDSEGSEDSGCILRFLRVDNKIRFNVDLGAADAARMKLNPKLLQVANAVKGKLHENPGDSR